MHRLSDAKGGRPPSQPPQRPVEDAGAGQAGRELLSLAKAMGPAAEPSVAHALRMAVRAHAGQVRKYTREPYVEHPIAVAKRVIAVFPDRDSACAALLHDVIEDTAMTEAEIAGSGLGPHVARLVAHLTDASRPQDGNRAARKAIDRRRLAGAEPRAKLVKLADLIDNTHSIVAHDPRFARVYLAEKRLLIDEALTNDGPPGSPLARAHDALRDEARALLERSEAALARAPGGAGRRRGRRAPAP